ncbi:class I adenylate-forming enzyme family protein [Streptomyces sp. H34-S4]|uniref:class I adenylate-forming enzyme family protein n=1 Tax=Streptomyces sp. H34-S4 TaxID=2996463 RepID=UPI00226D612A|nr:class I adenylate-forming enzyme family protein [Streptomyces sp. H34-S4]MCY0935102.1 class I adenylate-forming enzyme family protein [Streptomyces sp. H34-S4]
MPRLVYPELPLDSLLRRAAIRDPAGWAVRTGTGADSRTVTFAELDTQADRVAAYLEHTSGRRGVRVGVANTLDPVFAAAYYGTVRSGNTVVLVNPLVKEAGLAHVFTTAAVEVAFVPTATAELLLKLADRLPALRTVVVTDAPDGVVPGDALPLAAALDSAPERAALPGAVDLDGDACIQFTTGTTGRPKGVRLTHRNLVANAAQIAAAHHLGSDSVTLNHLPLYHVMHLNSAVYAGACQVLCADPDPVASLALAARVSATHYYGLPARLHVLAQDDRVTGEFPAGRSLTAVLSGGTALAPSVAGALSQRLGVPVVQGYGMAELSPLSHCQDLRSPKSGSVGPVVAGAECRIVHLDSRTALDVYSTGEVQVRGPQVMAGYLDDTGPSPVDADGWFTTGDVGYRTEDGALFLVDRLGDVFKYDNELVSPSAVEQVVSADPRVAECVVTGWPDPVHGAVVWLGIVLRDPLAPGLLDSIVEGANERLTHFEQIRRVEVLEAVPRNHVGKPERGSLRQGIRSRAAAEGGL